MSKVSDERLAKIAGQIDEWGETYSGHVPDILRALRELQSLRSASTPAKAVRVTDETGDVGLEPQREDAVAAIEIKMTPIAEALPVRDGMRGEQTILTYNDKVGTWGISFMEAGWDDYGSSFALGVTHWLDITSMWPGVIAQVASFAGKPIAWTSERELLRAANGNAGRLFANEDEDFAVPLYAHPTPAPNVPESQTVSALEDAPQQEVSKAIRDVVAERQRQVEVEGWTPEHDDSHADGEMGKAAGVYALAASHHHYRRVLRRSPVSDYLTAAFRMWPWDWSWFKPKNRRCDLVKAGALILAEIERLDRAALSHPSTPATGSEHE